MVKSELQQLHAQDPSLAELVEVGNDDYLTEKGASSDFKYVLRIVNNFAVDDIFIGSPQAISTNETDDSLRQYIESMQVTYAKKDFKALIPLACNQFHWVLAKVSFVQGKVTQAQLYDSLDGTHSGYAVFESIMMELGVDKEQISQDFTGEQCDDFRCFDYVCKNILVELKKLQHAIVVASNPENLRIAICETIGIHIHKPLCREDKVVQATFAQGSPQAGILQQLLASMQDAGVALDPSVLFTVSLGENGFEFQQTQRKEETPPNTPGEN